MRSQFILAFGTSLVFAAAAFGQNWINPAGGNWGNPSNWNGDAVPGAPVFDLNSASGYTVTLPSSEFGETVTVQTDNVTVDLDGYSIITTALNVATTAGQTGSLMLVGPGTISINNGQTGGSGSLDVGDQGGTGQLIVSDATILLSGAGAGHFDANGLVVENGGKAELDSSGNYTVTNATFNDGTFGAGLLSLGLDQVALTNGSSVGGYNVSIGNAMLDDSTIDAANTGTIEGTVTLSNDAWLNIPDESLSGTLYLAAGTRNAAAELTMGNGTISVELNGQISDPISLPLTQDNGTLDFTLQNGFEPTIGEQFAVLAFYDPNAHGTFATVNLPSLPAGGSWNISNLYTTGTISVVPEPISMGMMIFGMAGLALRRHHKSAHASA